MKKYILITGIIVIVVVVGIFVGMYIGNKDNDQALSNQNGQQVESNENQTDTNKNVVVTADTLAVHNNANDCWTVISGKVYDITKYIPRHPGGDDVLLACGTDGTSLFTQRQTSDGQDIGSGTPHSKSATSQLEPYLIGVFGSN